MSLVDETKDFLKNLNKGDAPFIFFYCPDFICKK